MEAAPSALDVIWVSWLAYASVLGLSCGNGIVSHIDFIFSSPSLSSQFLSPPLSTFSVTLCVSTRFAFTFPLVRVITLWACADKLLKGRVGIETVVHNLHVYYTFFFGVDCHVFLLAGALASFIFICLSFRMFALVALLSLWRSFLSSSDKRVVSSCVCAHIIITEMHIARWRILWSFQILGNDFALFYSMSNKVCVDLFVRWGQTWCSFVFCEKGWKCHSHPSAFSLINMDTVN